MIYNALQGKSCSDTKGLIVYKIRFANDFNNAVLCCSEGLQRIVDEINESYIKHGMVLNIRETISMVMEKYPEAKINKSQMEWC